MATEEDTYAICSAASAAEVDTEASDVRAKSPWWSRLAMHHDSPHLFVHCQWHWPPVAYCVYRALCAAYLCTWCVLSGLNTFSYNDRGVDRLKWFVYLTHWSFLVLCTSSLLRAAITCYATYHRNRDRHAFPEMTRLLKVNWAWYNIATCLAFVVSLMYWSVEYDGGHVSWINLNVHGINSVYALVDTVICATPIRPLHFYQPMIYGTCYITFNYLYYLCGGTDSAGNPYIYSVLDWRKPYAALVVGAGGTLVGVSCVWLTLYAIYRLRLRLRKRLQPHHSSGHDWWPAETGNDVTSQGVTNDGFTMSSLQDVVAASV